MDVADRIDESAFLWGCPVKLRTAFVVTAALVLALLAILGGFQTAFR